MSTENPPRQDQSCSYDFSALDNSTLVPGDDASSGQSHLSSPSQTSNLPTLGDHSYSAPVGRQPFVSGSRSFRKTRETAGLPSDIVHIISHGIRQSTQKNYSSFHQKWFQFTSERKVNPYIPSVKNLLLYFHWRHEQDNVGPAALMQERSALKWVVNSSSHAAIDNVLITRYLTGLFNLFPSPPKPPRDIWDINTVLSYWDNLPLSNELPLMLLSQKTVILILLSTMRRRHELLAMNLDHVFYYPNCMMFALDVYPKTFSLRSRLNHLRFVTVRKFPENPNLCPLLTLQIYLRKTSLIRATRKVFITTQNPFKAAASLTLRRWILTSLSDAGVNILKYAAPSTRHASSSKAYFAGVSVDTVMLRAGWINISSFVTHYNLPIIKSKHQTPAEYNQSRQTASHRAGSVQLDKPRTFYPFSRARNIKNAKNVAAQKLLRRSSNCLFKSTALFQEEAFVSPPPRVKRLQLKKPRRVEINTSTMRTTKKTSICKRKKPYVTYVTSLPEDQVLQSIESDDSAATIPAQDSDHEDV